MSETPRSGRVVPRGRPFVKGNPGRPKGARHKATMAAQMLLDGQAKALTQKAIDQALAGDTVALRLCLERLVPPRRDRIIRFALPALTNAGDAAAAMAAIAAAVASGEVTTGEAAELSGLVTAFAKALETSELEASIAALETREASR
jgi:hypothetical protein